MEALGRWLGSSRSTNVDLFICRRPTLVPADDVIDVDRRMWLAARARRHDLDEHRFGQEVHTLSRSRSAVSFER